MRWTVTLERDETGTIVAERPEIPGCIRQGNTEEEALANIREAIFGCLDVLHGARDVPEPAPPTEATAPPREPMLHDLLILGPEVAEDADFERRRHPRRKLPEWDT